MRVDEERNAHYGNSQNDQWQQKHLEKTLHAPKPSCNGAHEECAAKKSVGMRLKISHPIFITFNSSQSPWDYTQKETRHE
jgi:hypothetical protein